MAAKVRQPWTCPKCGRKLKVRSQEHACGLYDLEGHFANKAPINRVAFEWLCSTFDSLGDYDILPIKTTIAFANAVNFAFLTTKRDGAEISIVLYRALPSSRVHASVSYSRTKTIHRVLVKKQSDLDAEVESWLREAYAGTT